VDDGLVNGDQTVTIMAQVATASGVTLSQGSTSCALTVMEQDGPALALTLAADTIREGATTTATITRNTPTPSDLVVTLVIVIPRMPPCQPR